MTSTQLRTNFLKFFAERGHFIQPSSSLVPSNDKTLLFTNAGMVPFKDIFLGREKPSHTRVATTQRCLRAGGKHNDLNNVGYTTKHHTFFEMLGNFSFGDYFKKEAVHFAWDFLTKELKIPAEKLWVTVFKEDLETEKIWLEDIKIDTSRFSRIDTEDNFWSMGSVGTCGPCSEIFYDHGKHISGGHPGTPEQDGDRYVEIWNLVFMQYNRDKNGILHPLPVPAVDTGMGLERIATVMQGVHNNYEIDLFKDLLKVAAKLVGTTDLTQSSLQVVVDHIRAATFMVVDGILPSNEGRGYVLRRIIRRAIRHGYRWGKKKPFFYKLVEPLVIEMGKAFPELKQTQQQVERVLKNEEENFAETLYQCTKILESYLDKIIGNVIPGDIVFLLYDTHGFPVDLTADFAREHGLTIDTAGFEIAMSNQRNKARDSCKFIANYNQDIQHSSETEFTGYDSLNNYAKIIGLFNKNKVTDKLQEGDLGIVILDKTPLYAEAGGQVGDNGLIIFAESKAVFNVTNTKKQGDKLILHEGRVGKGTIISGQTCKVSANAEDRNATTLNHSATHILHAALKQVLGAHIAQKGSLVNPLRLRFDFSHFKPLTSKEINAIENLVNAQIRENHLISTKIMDKDKAINAGAIAMFDEKYADKVRVLSIGKFSIELCGGTHVNRTGDIGCFKIINENGISTGIRRIEALTGKTCFDWIINQDRVLSDITKLVKSSTNNGTCVKVQQLIEKNKQLEKVQNHLQSKLASSIGDKLSTQAVDINGVKVLAIKLDNINLKTMRDMVDQLKNKLGSAAIILATVKANKVSLIAGVSNNQTSRIKAVDLVNLVAVKVGGKGGGRADMAQAGGDCPIKLDAALKEVPAWVQKQISL